MKTSTIVALSLGIALAIAYLATQPLEAWGSGKEFGYALVEFGVLWAVGAVVVGGVMGGVNKALGAGKP